jgi:hypothetical protein
MGRELRVERFSRDEFRKVLSFGQRRRLRCVLIILLL